MNGANELKNIEQKLRSILELMPNDCPAVEWAIVIALQEINDVFAKEH